MDVTDFAPNNAAFQAIGSATADLTMMELAPILEYHGKHTYSNPTEGIFYTDLHTRQRHRRLQLHPHERHEPYHHRLERLSFCEQRQGRRS